MTNEQIADESARLRWRKFIGWLSELIWTNETGCLRCGRRWSACKAHHTSLTDNHGCFCLCQDCWSELVLADRIEYYRLAWRQHWHGEAWPTIWSAVVKDAESEGIL